VNLLLVEDEVRIADFVRRGLSAEGWSVTHAGDGETALELLRRDRFDVVVLDLMLPVLSGIEVCRRMRAAQDATPVLMLTAMGDVENRIQGLRHGADDYLPKPFEFDELVARVAALHRRSTNFHKTGSPGAGGHLACGAVAYDLEARQVTVSNVKVDLTKREREVLLLFLRNPNRLISHERLLNAVWGITEDPLTNAVDVHVARLRKKLGLAAGALRTVRGEGYILDCPPEARDTVASSEN
jgi:DNA-binding response OmpR family regulator